MKKRVTFSEDLAKNLIASSSSDSSGKMKASEDVPGTSSAAKKNPNEEEKIGFKDHSKPGSEEKEIDEQKKMLMSQESLLQMVKMSEIEQGWNLLRPCDSCEFLDPHQPLDTSCCWGLCVEGYKRPGPIHEFWLVSSPGGRNPPVTLEKLNEATASQRLSLNYKFHVPLLRTGNINELLTLTDAFRKLDVETERLIQKLADFMYAVLDEADDISEYFEVCNADIPTYITRFTWNAAKFPVKKTLPVLYGRVKDVVDSNNSQLLRRIKDFNNLDRSLQKIHRQLTGSLVTRSLHGIVKEKDIITNSKFLTSMLVVVEKNRVEEWMKNYEHLSEMVVPQSAVELMRDGNHVLFTAVVVSKHVDVFIRNATAMKFTVRDFQFQEGKSSEERELQRKLNNLRRAQIAVFYRWIKVSFSDCFSAWIHLKAMRIFVESVLRYGVPPDFHALLLMPLKSESKLRDVLKKLFSSIDSNLNSGRLEDIPGGLASYQVAEYYPYVFLPIKIGLFSEHKHV